jgi:5-methylcytosine-specific restriction endonuclease McrA
MELCTLKLNADYSCLEVISWQDAVSDWYTGHLDVVEFYEGHKLSSPSITINCPAVVKLKKYAKRNKDKVAYSNRGVFARDQYTCQYCGHAFLPKELTVDHILPKSRGGKKSWLNCTTSCIRCNRRKADRTPEEAGMPLLSEPTKPRLNPISKIRRHGTSHPEIWNNYM